MNRALIVFAVLIILVVPGSVGYYEVSHSKTEVSYQNLNKMVRSSVTSQIGMVVSWAEYNNVDLNSSSILEGVMHKFCVLENYTDFQAYYTNYSGAFRVTSGFEFNRSLFNASDPLGLDLDYFYFQFANIYTYNYNSTGLQQPTQVGSVIYSINVGTGLISGPKLSIHTKEYN